MKKCSIAICAMLTATLTGCQQPTPYASQAVTPPTSNTDNPTAQEQCTQLFASKPAVTNIHKLVATLEKANLKKDDFETTDAYRDRIAADMAKLGINTEKSYYFSVRLNPEHIAYDADRQILSIDALAITGKSVSTLHLNLDGQSASSIGTSDDIALPLYVSDKTTDSYMGQNAFGAVGSIDAIKHVQYGIYERPPQRKYMGYISRTETVFGWQDAPIFSLSMPPAEAKAVKQRGTLLVVATLAPPYFAKGEYHYGASLGTGEQHSYYQKYVIGDLQCAALSDGSGSIIATRPLQ